MDGDADSDGCPEEKPVVRDRDGDGILDESDKCPDAPEDKDGFEDFDGCPDPDNDRDGIPDKQDACPRVREVFNGIEDEDGCPDEGEELVVITDEQIQLLKGIRFKTASDEIIGQQSFDILNAVATVLKASPQIQVQIEGHTDSRGGREYNQDLSERRARSVMRYLYEHGVDETRMTAQGFGMDQPVDTNDTEEGRAANRRVVFRIVQDQKPGN
jgi:outer membrane protein OmpA-like peptidoglycan-associated protein